MIQQTDPYFAIPSLHSPLFPKEEENMIYILEETMNKQVNK